jgi:hypothetical protein
MARTPIVAPRITAIAVTGAALMAMETGCGPQLIGSRMSPENQEAQTVGSLPVTQVSSPVPSYCEGFAPDACGRIENVIEAKKLPPFCEPGFALVGSGLTDEQLRICYVITPDEIEKNKSAAEKLCDAADRHLAEENKRRAALDTKTQAWKRIEADNGAVYAIDMNSIQRGTYFGPQNPGVADAIVCIVDNDTLHRTYGYGASIAVATT